MEVGSQATPFEHRSFGEELALCQRYYYKQVVQITRVFMVLKVGIIQLLVGLDNGDLPVPMRAAPTISYTGTPMSSEWTSW